MAKRIKQTDEEKAEKNRKANREARRRHTRAGQEIGPIPEVEDWDRREACLSDPERFLRVYFGFPPYFDRPFCADHLRVIAKGQDVGVNGGLAAIAMPRGHGKTTICRGLSIHAIAYGLQRFVFLIGAAAGAAKRNMFAIKKMMTGSELFAADFPEIVFPAMSLGGSINRQKGQMCLEIPTEIQWSNEYLKLPILPDQPSMRPEQHLCGGAIFYASGLLGSAITGMNIEGIRPSMVILDDPQTRESAAKDAACAKREEIIDATVAGLAGPGVRLAVLMPCTVIREGDLADRYLNHVLHPEWAIERMPLLHSMPTNMSLWDANKEIRRNYNPYSGPEDKKRAETAATMHYIEHQAEMDAGAVASWPERFNPDEVSAIQNAMNMHADNRRSFYAEMQNQPLPPDLGDVKMLTADEICAKLSNVPRGEVPIDTSTLTAFIDVQKTVLYWGVAAWRDNFTGYIIDYGIFPQQGRPYVTLSDVGVTMEKFLNMGGMAEEAIIRAGLETLVMALLAKEWPREKSGQPHRIDLCVIDSGKWSKMIYEFCRRSTHGPRVMPSKGVYYGSGSRKAAGEGETKPGDKSGWHWHLPAAKEDRGVKLLLFDSNPWIQFVQARLSTAQGAVGCLSLFGSDQSAHRMFADHLTSKYADNKTSERTGRTVMEFADKPGKPDDHFLDVLKGLAVAASVQGVSLEGVYRPAKQQRQPSQKGGRSWAEMKRKAQAVA